MQLGREHRPVTRRRGADPRDQVRAHRGGHVWPRQGRAPVPGGVRREAGGGEVLLLFVDRLRCHVRRARKRGAAGVRAGGERALRADLRARRQGGVRGVRPERQCTQRCRRAERGACFAWPVQCVPQQADWGAGRGPAVVCAHRRGGDHGQREEGGDGAEERQLCAAEQHRVAQPQCGGDWHRPVGGAERAAPHRRQHHLRQPLHGAVVAAGQRARGEKRDLW
mmetsp:Transcript_22791/g.52972  ORF Transcript_22791/g.52972 Transcript_22791/m.52972 type:complete len:223 (+) Transcript_22791:465-1133(+)